MFASVEPAVRLFLLLVSCRTRTCADRRTVSLQGAYLPALAFFVPPSRSLAQFPSLMLSPRRPPRCPLCPTAFVSRCRSGHRRAPFVLGGPASWFWETSAGCLCSRCCSAPRVAVSFAVLWSYQRRGVAFPCVNRVPSCRSWFRPLPAHGLVHRQPAFTPSRPVRLVEFRATQPVCRMRRSRARVGGPFVCWRWCSSPRCVLRGRASPIRPVLVPPPRPSHSRCCVCDFPDARAAILRVCVACVTYIRTHVVSSARAGPACTHLLAACSALIPSSAGLFSPAASCPRPLC